MAEEARNNDAGVNLVELRETLVSRFSESDLRNLAFDLDIEYNSTISAILSIPMIQAGA